MLDRLSLILADRLALLVRQIIAESPHARPDHIGINLREAGLTSLDTVRLALGIETEFGVTIGADDFDPENFETLDALEMLVGRLSR